MHERKCTDIINPGKLVRAEMGNEAKKGSDKLLGNRLFFFFQGC